MTYQLLKDNIESLIAQKQYRVSKVEELAGLKYGNLSNILSGRSKKPSAEILLSIAKVFGVKVKDLFKSQEISASQHLSQEQIVLYLDITAYLNEKIISHNIEIYYQDFVSIINEIYEYFASSQDYKLDKKFIDWFVKQKFSL